MSKLRNVLILSSTLGLALSCAYTAYAGDAQKAATATSSTTASDKAAAATADGANKNRFNNVEKLKPGEKVNLNTATVDELQKVRGIGQKKAEIIVEYRTKNGNFKTLNDLTSVKGRGFNKAWFDKVSTQLTL